MDLLCTVPTTSQGMSAMMDSTRPSRGTQFRLTHKKVRDSDERNPNAKSNNVTAKVNEYEPISHSLLHSGREGVRNHAKYICCKFLHHALNDTSERGRAT